MKNPFISPQKELFIAVYLLFFLFLPKNAVSQQYTISYEYDAAGNRISRTSEIILPKSAKMEADSTEDLSYEEIMAMLNKEEKYESFDEEVKYTIYPNPTYGRIVLEISPLPEDFENASLLLFDLSGKLLFKIDKLSTYNLVNLYDQPAGNYIIELSSANKNLRWKIVKK